MGGGPELARGDWWVGQRYVVDLTSIMLITPCTCSSECVSDVVDFIDFVDRRPCSSLAGEQKLYPGPG